MVTQASNAVSGMNGNGFSTGNYQISGESPTPARNSSMARPINNGYINAISYIPSQDSIQEFRVEGKRDWAGIRRHHERRRHHGDQERFQCFPR